MIYIWLRAFEIKFWKNFETRAPLAYAYDLLEDRQTDGYHWVA